MLEMKISKFKHWKCGILMKLLTNKLLMNWLVKPWSMGIPKKILYNSPYMNSDLCVVAALEIQKSDVAVGRKKKYRKETYTQFMTMLRIVGDISWIKKMLTERTF